MKKTTIFLLSSFAIWFFPLIFAAVTILGQNPLVLQNQPAVASPVDNTKVYLPIMYLAQGYVVQEDDWPMAGANPERSSWTSEEVRGALKPLWYIPLEAYIPDKYQLIATNNTIFVSTAKGLFALDANTGAEKWVYPTEMPLGQSPTIYRGVAYVGGLDKRIHAVNITNGQGLWKFEAGAGFDTNPLIVNARLFAGNRDGYFYAIYIDGLQAGQIAWKYQTQGPIHISAAYKDGVIFFASDDGHAYALNADNGSLVWKSELLPGAGFHSWWPVVYRDWVVFTGSHNFRASSGLGPNSSLPVMEREDVYPNAISDPRGTLVGPLGTQSGDWATGTPTINTSQSTFTGNGHTTAITEYLEQKPWRRTFLVLNRYSGEEYTTDFDNDGQPEYAPVLWQGTHSGNRFPPVVGADDVIYTANNYMSDPYIAGGQVSGWKIGTPYISIVSSDWTAIDEFFAFSAGGDLIYWNLCCDREAGSYDITQPNTLFADRYNQGIRPATDLYMTSREWKYFEYNLDSLIPGYSSQYTWGVYGGQNGIYSNGGNQNPPIPYNGKVYMHRSNAVIAFAPTAANPVQLPVFQQVSIDDPSIPLLPNSVVQSKLEDEVEKILSAGHLRPGYYSSGLLDFSAHHLCGDRLTEYWHSPGDVLYTLIQALPYLPSELASRVRIYIQQEFNAFSPYEYSHIGWQDGAAREFFIMPPEFASELIYYPPESQTYDFAGWRYDPNNFYILWKYAELFGGASMIFNASKYRLDDVPADSYLLDFPHVHNAFINGYMGYLELEKLAGYPESTDVRNQLNHLLTLRVTHFTIEPPDLWLNGPFEYILCTFLNISYNFLYLTPELGQYLHDNAYDIVNAAVAEYSNLAPYWFLSKYDATIGEGIMSPLYDYHALMQARALILKEPQQELLKYLDVPAVPVGDLFYIDNLVAILGSQSNH